MKKPLIFTYILLFALSSQAQITGHVLHFDGDDDGVDLNSALLSTTDGKKEYTIEAWIKTEEGDDDCILCQYNWPGNMRFQFEVRENKLNWWKGITKDDKIFVYSTDSIADNTWHHVAATRDSLGNVTLYIDGLADGTGIDSLPFVDYNTSIGSRISSDEGEFNGEIDELRIWNFAKTSAQVLAQKNKRLQGNEAGLLAYYNFNQGAAGGDNRSITSLEDVSLNQNDGSFIDFALIGDSSNFIMSTLILSDNKLEYIETDLLIKPNPSVGSVTFAFPSDVRGQLHIRNILGQEVHRLEIQNQTELHIDISELEAGMYFVSMVSDGVKYSSKIIKH